MMQMPNTLRSRIALQILIHFHVSEDPLPLPPSRAVSSAIERLERLGVIRPSRDSYVTTPLGCGWIASLCRVPMPTSES